MGDSVKIFYITYNFLKLKIKCKSLEKNISKLNIEIASLESVNSEYNSKLFNLEKDVRKLTKLFTGDWARI